MKEGTAQMAAAACSQVGVAALGVQGEHQIEGLAALFYRKTVRQVHSCTLASANNGVEAAGSQAAAAAAAGMSRITE
jgi:hypothetical protein